MSEIVKKLGADDELMTVKLPDPVAGRCKVKTNVFDAVEAAVYCARQIVVYPLVVELLAVASTPNPCWAPVKLSSRMRKLTKSPVSTLLAMRPTN